MHISSHPGFFRPLCNLIGRTSLAVHGLNARRLGRSMAGKYLPAVLGSILALLWRHGRMIRSSPRHQNAPSLCARASWKQRWARPGSSRPSGGYRRWKAQHSAGAQRVGDIPQNANFAIKTSVVLNFLEANGVRVDSSSVALPPLAPADLADRAKTFTAFVYCHR